MSSSNRVDSREELLSDLETLGYRVTKKTSRGRKFIITCKRPSASESAADTKKGGRGQEPDKWQEGKH